MMNEDTLRRNSKRILIALCLASFALMLSASLRDAAVVDELAHIPAGYAYDRFFDYRLNPEHPPLLKAAAALPLLFMNLRFPTDNTFWTENVNGEWGVGGAFLYGLGNNADLVIGMARIIPILLTIGLVLLTFFWANRLFGPAWALLPTTLTALSPIILANGHYVTTDIAATFGAMLGLYTFTRYMDARTPKNLLLAGLGFGVAEVMKFSTAILIPVYALLMVVHYFAARKRGETVRFRDHALGYIAILALGTAVIIYPLYAIFTAHYPAARQVSDTASTLGAIAAKACGLTNVMPCLARFDIWSAGHAVTRPLAEYLLGLLVVFERVAGPTVSYFLGKVSSEGSRLYFPVVYALKETIPALIIVVVGFVLGAVRVVRALFRRAAGAADYLAENFAVFSMLVFVAAYWAASIESPLNIGVRHLLPTIPFVYIAATGAVRRVTPRIGKSVFVGLMLVWLALETAFAYPNYLSYFNELGQGTANGYQYVTDSNYDWGQDMGALRSFIAAHPEIDRLALDFFGGSNPAYYLGNTYVAWTSAMGNPSERGIHWFAISINNLQLAIQPAAPGYVRSPADTYGWLLAAHPKGNDPGSVPAPDYRVGTTIFIYKI